MLDKYLKWILHIWLKCVISYLKRIPVKFLCNSYFMVIGQDKWLLKNVKCLICNFSFQGNHLGIKTWNIEKSLNCHLIFIIICIGSVPSIYFLILSHSLLTNSVYIVSRQQMLVCKWVHFIATCVCGREEERGRGRQRERENAMSSKVTPKIVKLF